MKTTEIKQAWKLLHDRRYRIISMELNATIKAWQYSFTGLKLDMLIRAVNAWIDDQPGIPVWETRPWPQTFEIAEYLETHQLVPPPPAGGPEWWPPTGAMQVMEWMPSAREELDLTPVRWAEFRRMWAGHEAHRRAGCQNVYPGLLLGFQAMGINEYTAKIWPFPLGLTQEPIGADRSCGGWCQIGSHHTRPQPPASQGPDGFAEVIQDMRSRVRSET